MSFENLRRARQIIDQDKEKKAEIKENEELQEGYDILVETFRHHMYNNTFDTLALDYDKFEGVVKVTIRENLKASMIKIRTTQEEYWKFTKEILQLDPDEQYNSSQTEKLYETKARVYSIMPPVSEFPIVTISTTKPVLSDMSIPDDPKAREVLTDELFKDIINSTFILVGASGAGKTYFLNTYLNKYLGGSDERIAEVAEFQELTPVNDYWISMETPPVHPGEKPLLKWATEASNLMRLDRFIVGEIKGEEAWPFLQNSLTNKGISTVHGHNARAGLARLSTLAQLSGPNVTPQIADEFVAKAINYVIALRKHQIFQVVKLTGTVTNGNFTLQQLYLNESLLQEGEKII